MVSEDEYAQLVLIARDALHDLIKHSKPGTGWTLHQAYRSIERWLEQHEGQEKHELEERRREQDRQQELLETLQGGLPASVGTGDEDEGRARQRVRAEWRSIPMIVREHLVIELVGEDRLTASGVREKLEQSLPACLILTDDAGTVLRRLWKAGELDRVSDRLGGRQVYRYFRNLELSGPIAELERLFGEPPAEAG